MARGKSTKGGSKGEKWNMAVNERLADIHTAAKAQNAGVSYEKGYPAHDSVHINEGSAGKRFTGRK